MTDENHDGCRASKYGFIGNEEIAKRSLRLCHDVLRNYAYYRATRRLTAIVPGDFTRTVNGNFLEMVVLDWCKLFADSAGEHHWHRSFNQKKNSEPLLQKKLGRQKSSSMPMLNQFWLTEINLLHI